MRRTQWAGRIGVLVLVGAAYYLGARLGLELSVVVDNVTPLWPPTGIAVAAFLLLGRKTWPAVAIAALAVNLPISEGPLPALVTAAGNVAAPLVAVTLLHMVGFRRQLDSQRDALAIVFLGALASMTVSAAVGSLTLAVSGAIPADELPAAWAVWWTGDAMGVLAVAPFLLCLPLFRELEPWPPVRWLEAVTILVVVAAVMAWTASTELHVMFLVIPVLGWASWRLQLRGAAPAALIASLVATWAATRELGPFAQGSLFERMLTLQGFNACVALTSFFLAALVSERMRNAEALAAAAEARAHRDHEIAATLQRSLLPDRLPELPGVELAARYVPASSDVQVGGDWYDVVHLPGGQIAMAIGDVAGHGVQAAATMGQIRMALRSYALQDPAPVSVVSGVHRLVSHLPMADMVTLIYLVYDPASRALRYANAGHPPALVVDRGSGTYLEEGLSPPIGVTSDARYTEVCYDLAAGAVLLLYTDGLVERRDESIQQGLDRLRTESVAGADNDLDSLCDLLLASVVGDDRVTDDIALVALRAVALRDGPLTVALQAEPRVLAEVRSALRRWLRECSVGDLDEQDIVAACGEACANVVQHAYSARPGQLLLEARLVDRTVHVSVRDSGHWRPAADRGGGWGLPLIGSLMDTVDVHRDAQGTEVRMSRRLREGGGHG